MNNFKYRFTVFTATYNRCDMLPQLYESLVKQTFDRSRFEWIIVSDGSTDNTPSVVKGFVDTGELNIRFINKESGGKHTAWIAATPKFEGEYVVTCDDDDPVDPRMLEIFDKYWSELEKSPVYDSFWEVKARVKREDGVLVGPELSQPYFDSDYNEMVFKYGINCEMHGCRKSTVMKSLAAVPNYFPFQDKCSNYPEGIRWSAAARRFKTRFVPEVTRTYVVGHDSLCVTTDKRKRSSRKNYNSIVSALCCINNQKDLFLKYKPLKYYTFFAHLAHSAVRQNISVVKYINSSSDRVIYRILFPPIYFFTKLGII